MTVETKDAFSSSTKDCLHYGERVNITFFQTIIRPTLSNRAIGLQKCHLKLPVEVDF